MFGLVTKLNLKLHNKFGGFLGVGLVAVNNAEIPKPVCGYHAVKLKVEDNSSRVILI
jgi:hypothetical protein